MAGGVGANRRRRPGESGATEEFVDLAINMLQKAFGKSITHWDKMFMIMWQLQHIFQGTWISGSKPLEPVLGREFHVESDV